MKSYGNSSSPVIGYEGQLSGGGGGVIYRVQRTTRSVCMQFLGTESSSLQTMAYWHTESAMDCATVPMVLIISFDYSLETNRLV